MCKKKTKKLLPTFSSLATAMFLPHKYVEQLNLLGEQRCRIFIQESGAIRVFLQHGGGAHIGDGAFESIFHGFRFAEIRQIGRAHV